MLYRNKVTWGIDKPVLHDSRLGMINLTERAIGAIQSLADQRAEDGQHMRLSVKSGGCSGMEYAMEFAFPTDKDIRKEQDGLTYLIDRRSLKLLEGSEIDYDDGLAGKGFEIRNPNAESTCGCGRSFA